MRPELARVATAAVALIALGGPPSAAAQTGAPARVVVRDSASELACGPMAAAVRPATGIQILGGEEWGRGQFAPGDRVVINAGSSQGLAPGQEYFIRRIITDRYAEKLAEVDPISIHTAGWLRLIDVETDRSIGAVSRACDAVHDGDYLEPFVLPAVPTALPSAAPDFANPGRVLLADERRQLGAPGMLMVLDRGSDHGLRPGQQLTIFRMAPGGPILRVGGATALAVSPATSTIRIDQSRDAIYVGDKVAIHR